MASLVDEFVIALGLDPSGVSRGSKQVRDELKRTGDAADTAAGRMESAGKHAANYFANVRNEVVGLMLAFAGGRGLKAIAGDMIDTAASVGRLSSNIGVSTEQISAWQGVVEQAGGSAGEANGALKQMAMTLADVKMGLRPANAGILQAFGLTQDTMKDPMDMLLRIADASQHMDRVVFTDLASRLGLSDATISLLGEGRTAVKKYLDEMGRFYALHKQDTEAARAFNWELKGLELTIEGRLYPAMTPLLKSFNTWIRTGDNARNTAIVVAGALGGLAIAAVAPFAPLMAIGAAIAFVLEKSGRMQDVLPELGNELSTFSRRLAFAKDEWDALKNHDWKRLGGLLKQEYDDSNSGALQTTDPHAFSNLKGSVDRYLARHGAVGDHVAGAVHAIASGRKPRAVALSGNNPGGIEDGPFARKQPGYAGPNGRYAAFDTMANGEAAQLALLLSYVHRGFDTPSRIAARWAPAKDGNNPARYAATIARIMGIGVNDHITSLNAVRFAQAQGRAENSAYRASGAVSIGAINVYPQSGDPKVIANEVAKTLKNRLRTTQADGAFN